MSKKKKFAIMLCAAVAIFIVAIIFHNNYLFKYRMIAIYPRIFISERIDSMDYILTNQGEEIKLLRVVTIEPTIWKGSSQGTLFYKDGTSVEVKISSYGNFFGIEGENHALFSDGVLYHYESD